LQDFEPVHHANQHLLIKMKNLGYLKFSLYHF